MTGRTPGFRKKAGGAELKRKAEEKEKKEQEVVAKTRKLDQFFVTSKRMGDGAGPSVKDGNEESVVDKCSDNSGAGAGSSGDGNGSACSEFPVPDDKKTAAETGVRMKPGDDPFFWEINQETIDYFLEKGFKQNIDSDFSKSLRISGENVKRHCSLKLFRRKLKNALFVDRKNLIYSPSQGSIYCAQCMLFNNGATRFSSKTGFSDWAHAEKRINEHENSSPHRDCIIKFADARSELQRRIDEELRDQIEKEREYWRNVLRRVVSVIKKLASRGLPFRGTVEKFGSVSNGNFMMCLELIAEYDVFLAEHIAKYGSSGSGNVSYLSSATYEELLEIMGNSVHAHVVDLVKAAKYFSLIVDSTRDLNKKDQLALIVRYVNALGVPEERFLTFLENRGHKGEEMAEAVLEYLELIDLPIEDCRGQSYDNAANMSGPFKGLQARLKTANSLVEYIPCAGHSLNLSGSLAAGCCKVTLDYFDFVQNLYNFLSSSTDRWDIFLSLCGKKENRTLKTLSGTRWNARDKACEALYLNGKVLVKTLIIISEDEDDKRKKADRIKAKSYLNKLRSFEMIFMTIFWRAVFIQFGKVQHDIQSQKMHVATAELLYDSLIVYLEELKNSFEIYFKKASEKFSELQSVHEKEESKSADVSGLSNSRPQRRRTKKRFFDEDPESPESEAEEEEDVPSTSANRDEGEDDPRVNEKKLRESFDKILESLVDDIQERILAYKEFAGKFSFLSELPSLDAEQIAEAAGQLCETYDKDLEDSLFEECLHLKGYLIKLNATSSSTSNSTESETPSDPSLAQIYRCLVLKGLENVYPNVCIALKIYLSVPVTNCSAERSFSALGRVHNYLRTSQAQDRLTNVAIMNIESDITIEMNFDDVIDEFARAKSRKKTF